MARKSTPTTRGPARTLLVAALALAALAWLGSDAARAAFPGEEGKIAFTRGGLVWVMNSDGSCQSRITDTRADRFPAWSPDGRRIASSRSDPPHEWPPGPTDIQVMNAWGGDRRNLTEGEPGGHSSHSPTWSPDGERIVFQRGGIWVMNSDGSDKKRLTDPDRWISLSGPAWSPAGGRIAFVGYGRADTNTGFDSGLYVMDEDGGGVTKLADVHGDSLRDPAWSPDGERIAFTALYEGGSMRSPFSYKRIYAMNSDGSGLTTVIQDSFLSSPTWGPDGERIAFRRGYRTTESEGIWAIGVDGTGLVQLTRRNDGSPDWHARDLPPWAQVCFQGLARNTARSIARLAVRVPGPGRVVLRRGPGVRRFARTHEAAGPGRVMLRVRPRGWARQRLNRQVQRSGRGRVRVRAWVTYWPRVGAQVTKSRWVWLVKR